MIYVNARFLTQRKTGVQQYALVLCRELTKHISDVCFVTPNCELIDDSWRQEFNIIQVGKCNGHLWEQIELPRYLKSIGSPLLLCFTGLSPFFYKNCYFTIHDMSLYAYPKWFRFLYRAVYKINYFIQSKCARGIFTVSDFSKSEIEKYLAVSSEKITVLRNSVDWSMHFQSERNPAPERRNEILLVGTLEPRKNIEFVIDAFLKADISDYKLIVVGGIGTAFSKVNLSQHEKIIFCGYLSDQELQLKYKEASIFVYPSLYEGFGLPPLEAMQRGCPVMASDRTSIPEVCGDAAYYFNPEDAVDFTKKLHKLINNYEEIAPGLIHNGYHRLEEFKVSDVIDKLLDVIGQRNI
ncbi:glycosyl transferase family 1 [Cedecea neteri]|uniref:Glycosyl transferase family 1 n=1 Tax=Cedecea neteri TaxID=158822 RepID=A0AAN0VV97_9ENTR|nr:glycosyltransferase family 1 protein [Cedecea neteri]AIR62964.1 glycosyl transferase family 1 [Cedecea neteri]